MHEMFHTDLLTGERTVILCGLNCVMEEQNARGSDAL